ncbi:TPA: hypothetical protein EYN98_24725 [Candidatus Poribacteria bacterium]|nr:hypothetical protein [Candidatus Poribacteria bacterium]HIB86247.1 hypothetical protein [Candidatus Poribacteria bacterium]HIC02502.1 hypothetical protein [Candidatus Poribacteria bacterium]
MVGNQSGIMPPIAQIVSIETDQTYTNLSRIPSITSGNRFTVTCKAIDFKTLPDKRQSGIEYRN